MNALLRRFPVVAAESARVLLDLVQDRDGRWRRPWIKACAVYTASEMPDVDLDAIDGGRAEQLAAFGADRRGSIVHETLAGIRRRRRGDRVR